MFSTVGSPAVTTYTTYDGFNRPTHVTDFRTGVTKTDYRSNISDAV